jgi:hypothetical protein
VLISQMGEESRLGLNLEKHQVMRDNLSKERSMELEDIFAEMNGSIKVIFLTIKSQVQKEELSIKMASLTSEISRMGKKMDLGFINGPMALFSKAGMLMIRNKDMVSSERPITNFSKDNGRMVSAKVKAPY